MEIMVMINVGGDTGTMQTDGTVMVLMSLQRAAFRPEFASAYSASTDFSVHPTQQCLAHLKIRFHVLWGGKILTLSKNNKLASCQRSQLEELSAENLCFNTKDPGPKAGCDAHACSCSSGTFQNPILSKEPGPKSVADQAQNTLACQTG